MTYAISEYTRFKLLHKLITRSYSILFEPIYDNLKNIYDNYLTKQYSFCELFEETLNFTTKSGLKTGTYPIIESTYSKIK